MELNGHRPQRRPPEAEPLLAELDHYDYADSFELRLKAPAEGTPEEWMRRAIGGSSATIKATVGVAWRYLLRFELQSGPGQLFGMPIVESTPAVAYMRGESPLLEGHLIGRRVEPTLIALTTALVYRQSRRAGLVWATCGPAHRRIAPYLLERAASPAPA